MAVPADLIELGHISGAHGIKGWVRVRPWSQGSENLLQADTWWLKAPDSFSGSGAFSLLSSQTGHNYLQIKVNNTREHGATMVALLNGISDRNAAETLKGCVVCIRRSDFIEPDIDEYYWTDIIGCLLYGQNGLGETVLIGEVTGMQDNGAHGILQVSRIKNTVEKVSLPVRSSDKSGPSYSDLFMLDKKSRPVQELVPFVKAHVHTVDLERRILLSNWVID